MFVQRVRSTANNTKSTIPEIGYWKLIVLSRVQPKKTGELSCLSCCCTSTCYIHKQAHKRVENNNSSRSSYIFRSGYPKQ